MKRLALTTALILTAASPVLAQTQLERQLNVPAGKYTTAQLIELKSASEQTGSDAEVYFAETGRMTMATSNVVNDRALAIVAANARGQDSGNDRGFVPEAGNYTGPLVNERAAAIVRAEARSADDGLARAYADRPAS